MNIDDIREAISGNRVRNSDHADEEARKDYLSTGEIFHSVQSGEIIEDYPDSRPLPSCLIYGQTAGSAPVHSVWGYNEHTGEAVLITVYRPDPRRWIDWRVRR